MNTIAKLSFPLFSFSSPDSLKHFDKISANSQIKKFLFNNTKFRQSSKKTYTEG